MCISVVYVVKLYYNTRCKKYKIYFIVCMGNVTFYCEGLNFRQHCC